MSKRKIANVNATIGPFRKRFKPISIHFNILRIKKDVRTEHVYAITKQNGNDDNSYYLCSMNCHDEHLIPLLSFNTMNKVFIDFQVIDEIGILMVFDAKQSQLIAIYKQFYGFNNRETHIIYNLRANCKYQIGFVHHTKGQSYYRIEHGHCYDIIELPHKKPFMDIHKYPTLKRFHTIFYSVEKTTSNVYTNITFPKLNSYITEELCMYRGLNSHKIKLSHQEIKCLVNIHQFENYVFFLLRSIEQDCGYVIRLNIHTLCTDTIKISTSVANLMICALSKSNLLLISKEHNNASHKINREYLDEKMDVSKITIKVNYPDQMKELLMKEKDHFIDTIIKYNHNYYL